MATLCDICERDEAVYGVVVPETGTIVPTLCETCGDAVARVARIERERYASNVAPLAGTARLYPPTQLDANRGKN